MNSEKDSVYFQTYRFLVFIFWIHNVGRKDPTHCVSIGVKCDIGDDGYALLPHAMEMLPSGNY
jgi:hypothetical protein